MAVPAKPDKPPTVEQIRRDVDTGRSGDKHAYPDPAAAPLGADEEAAGSPPRGEERRREDPAPSPVPVETREPTSGFGRHLALILAAAAGIAALAYLLLQA
jgi:hypothetical protein